LFKIDDVQIVEPIQLQVTRVDNIVSQIATQSGRIIADIRGWKYADTTLYWGTIPETQLQYLLPLNEFTMTFDDIDGEKTVNVIRKGFTGQKQRFTVDGAAFYANFGLEVMFPDVYNE